MSKSIDYHLKNSLDFISSTLKSDSIYNKNYKNYSFAWLGRVRSQELEVVFKTSTPARFANTNNFNLSLASSDKIFIEMAQQAIAQKKSVTLSINSKDMFPSRRECDTEFKSAIAIPMLNEGEVVAVLCVYLFESIVEKDELVKLQELALSLLVSFDLSNAVELLENVEVL